MKLKRIVLAAALTAGMTTLCNVSHGADATASVAKKKSKMSAKKAPVTGSSARIYVDPVTGEMGAPPAGAEPVRSQMDVSNQRTAVTVNRDGSLTAVVPRERMVYAVATTTTDGGIAVSEVTAKDIEKLLKPARKGEKR